MIKIASFAIDHNKLKKGLYVSRVDGDVITYDIRMREPNKGDYLSNGVLHTFEHLFATYVRSGRFSEQIIYVGPMGCRTGFYFLTRDGISKADVITLLCETFAFIADFAGEIPGAKAAECGNYQEHDLAGAQTAAREMVAVLADWTPEKMAYEA